MGVDCYDKIYWSNSKTTPIWKILEKQHKNVSTVHEGCCIKKGKEAITVISEKYSLAVQYI